MSGKRRKRKRKLARQHETVRCPLEPPEVAASTWATVSRAKLTIMTPERTAMRNMIRDWLVPLDILLRESSTAERARLLSD
jgi:hypothetical protein